MKIGVSTWHTLISQQKRIRSYLYSYIKDYGYNYIYKIFQLVITLFTRKKSSIDLLLKIVMIFDFLCTLDSKPLQKYKKPKFKFRDRSLFSKYDLFFREDCKPKITQKVIEIVAFFPGSLQQTQKTLNKMKLSVVIYMKKC